MRNFIKIALITIVLVVMVGCRSQVVYDEYNDSFRYKPESEWDYINDL
ncbi:MAG: hypothetical protein KBC30_00355 [Planctomycetes bacterium]|jgi:hypothetical protein|nr:hypothetical protein [Planctomycetota bacterium]HPY73820.1 hypothetical protein [Planctomycetota bacterium]HPY73828.1 hypothetical protein [Planctomycetota bacterium]HQA99470.1 hypothetical protein [Planctomycetota bacterium]HQA99478.1 hypothetical protein [Planctomycetota bacterium]